MKMENRVICTWLALDGEDSTRPTPGTSISASGLGHLHEILGPRCLGTHLVSSWAGNKS